MVDDPMYSAKHWAKKAEYWAGQSHADQIQSDFAQGDNTKVDFIKNKPTPDSFLSGVRTNCITYIPQDIKLELDNGTLTLKAGSKVYVPNGFEADGTTPRFDEAVAQTDIVAGTSGATSDTQAMLVAKTSDGIITGITWQGSNESGTSSTASSTYTIYYNTALNKVGYASTTTTVDYSANGSLPISLCTSIANHGGWKSIDQIFNGFGYVGSTIFVLPGVKGLIPNGRNTDGTLNNTAFTVPSVLVRTFTQTEIKTNIALRQHDVGYHTFVYNEVDNLNDVQNYANVGSMTLTSGAISNFNPKTVFHALDWNDGATIAGCSMPSDNFINLTLGTSGTQYTAPANGFIVVGKAATASGQYINLDGAVRYAVNTSTSSQTPYLSIPVARGASFTVSYNVGGATSIFRFIFARGEVE